MLQKCGRLTLHMCHMILAIAASLASAIATHLNDLQGTYNPLLILKEHGRLYASMINFSNKCPVQDMRCVES